METNNKKRGRGGFCLITIIFFAVIATLAYLFSVSIVAFIIGLVGVIVLPIVGLFIYEQFIRFKHGIVVDKQFVPEHYEKVRRSWGHGNRREWYTEMVLIPDAYYLTMKGESRGKERTLLFSVTKDDFDAATVGVKKYVEPYFLLEIEPLEVRLKNRVEKAEYDAYIEQLNKEKEENARIAAEEATNRVNPTATEVAEKTNLNIFSIIGVGLNLFLVFLFLRLWISPQYSDIDLIYSLAMMIFFEFVLVHSGTFMSLLIGAPLRKSWWKWLFFILFYGSFALAINASVPGNTILIFYAFVVINRMLSKSRKAKGEKKSGLVISFLYMILYAAVLIAVIGFAQNSIPKFGLTEDFLRATDWNNVAGEGFLLPHVMMCFGVVYYTLLTIVDLTFMMIGKEKKKRWIDENVEMRYG